MKKLISFSLSLVLAVLFSGLWSCSKTCDIRLKNGTIGDIKVFTKVSGKENSAVLKPGDILKVGQCTDCTELDEAEIQVDAMLVSLGMSELEMKDKKEVLTFLGQLSSEDCVVKVFK